MNPIVYVLIINFFFSCSSFCQVVYSKSDQQRQRLAETVKNIFIFRSLDQVTIDYAVNYEILLVNTKKKTTQLSLKTGVEFEIIKCHSKWRLVTSVVLVYVPALCFPRALLTIQRRYP